MNIFDLINYIKFKSNELNIPIDYLKLQKFLYFIQGYALSEFNEPAFDNDLKKGKQGLYVPEIYNKLKQNSFLPIQKLETETIIEPNFPLNIITDAVIKACKNDSSKELENKINSEKPWKETAENEVISLELLAEFFRNENPLNIDINSTIIENEEEYTKFVHYILDRDREIFDGLT